MTAPPPTPPGHWVQCPECLRFFENEQGRGSHRLHTHGIHGTGEHWTPARSLPSPASVLPPAATIETAASQPPAAPPASAPTETPADPDGQTAAAGLSTIAQVLATTPPPPTMGKFGRGGVVFLFFVLSGVALYLVVRELEGANEPERPYVIDPARIQPGAPILTTGDPYWDSILGYRGLRI